ncbi:MAG TPA: hypothetical protein VFS21_33420 [Roseiflexaceae bacterium]|nr:hypothetical protein [Roseiflexaceae bacterium]
MAIDAEAQICDLTAEVLADAGYIVQVVQDGAGTLATMTRHRPALISIDPERSDQLSRRTRTVERMSTSIVLMTTATQG